MEANQHSNFWNAWKKCGENIYTKTPLNCDGEKWESYYSKLFKGYNDLDNNRNTSLKNLRRISNKSLEFINKLTNNAELKNIIKILKLGRAPGLDRILNEMIKYSFDFLKNCYVKLFNLILKTGIVPRIWCKGSITLVHKKGDPSNPDNFRPICVLSCLSRFLTNILNSRLMDVCKKHNLIHASQIGF